MKKAIPFLFLFIFQFHFSHSQNPTPNPGFEDWTLITSPTQYLIPNGWDQLNAATNFIGILTCVQTSDAHSGSFAAKLITKPVTIGPLSDTANGIITTGVLITTPPYGVKWGIPFDQKPDSIAGWYKYTPTDNDSCQIEFDLIGGTHDTIGKAVFKNGGNVSTYTRFSAPIVYFSSGTPDTSLWLISSSNGFAALPNSTLYIDDIELVFHTGIHDPVYTSGIHVTNTLVQDQIIIQNPGKVRGTIELYDAFGKNIGQFRMDKNEARIAAGTLPNGVYLCVFKDEKGKQLSDAKVMIQK